MKHQKVGVLILLNPTTTSNRWITRREPGLHDVKLKIAYVAPAGRHSDIHCASVPRGGDGLRSPAVRAGHRAW